MNDYSRPTAGLDWLAVKATNSYDVRILLDLATEILDDAIARGAKYRQSNRYGYEGWSVDVASFGWREEAVMMNVWGASAEAYYERVARAMFLEVKRLDVAVTMEVENPYQLAARAYVDYNRKLGGTKARYSPKATLLTSNDGGQTLYLGKRGNERMGRIYDKGVQGGTHVAGKYWRWEVELRHGAAQTLWDAMKKHGKSSEMIASYVRKYFAERGLAFKGFGEGEHYEIERYVKVDCLEKKLAWLERCVKPVATQLILAGKSRSMYDSLGLGDTLGDFENIIYGGQDGC